MGVDLNLYVEDESIKGPYLKRSFKDEILFEGYLNFADFLNEDEIKIVRPNMEGEIVLGRKREATLIEKAKIPFLLSKAMKGKISIVEINKMRDKLVIRSEKIADRERDPERLKEALKKVENYLFFKKDKLPLVHFVYETKALEVEVNVVVIDGVQSDIKGDLFFYDNYLDLRKKIHLKSYFDDHGAVDFFIDVKPKIKLDNKIYFTRTITKSAQFAEDFENCYQFLDQAIEKNKKILWEYG